MTGWSRRRSTRPSTDQWMRKDGHRLAVLRPVDPEVARAAIEKATALVGADSSDPRAFNEILNDGAERVYEGLATKDGRIADPATGLDRGELQPGDSFVPEYQLDELAKLRARS